MSDPSLDFFYNNISLQEFEKILCNISLKNDILFFNLYNNAPPRLKPSLEDKSYFVSRLCSRIEVLKGKDFNYWFFDNNLSKFYGLNQIRDLANRQKNNDMLNSFLKEKDIPKNTASLLDKLSYIREKDSVQYYKLIEENKIN